MKRREMLLASGAAVLGLSAFPLRWVAAQEKKKHKVLYFSRSQTFEHDPVMLRNGGPSLSDEWFTKLGEKTGTEFVCTKDGAVFDGDLDQYDGFIFYVTGDLTKPCSNAAANPGAPMSAEGKKKFLDAIKAGKGFVGIHSATDAFHTGPKRIDPYTAMIGGEFIIHGAQQNAVMRVTDPKFPGVQGLGNSFKVWDEWYTMYKFAKDLHVILVQETKGMRGNVYQRPPYPATWAHRYGKGRVFYTSMGHGNETWEKKKIFAQVLSGGLAWSLGNAEADLVANIAEVTPEAEVLPKAK
jgi:type 1 glutamine amidotransferase